MTTHGRLYWPELDGLRFLAVMLVFVHHANLVPGIPASLRSFGWIGVDLFLALSAFLLTRLLRTEIERTGSVNVRNFFIRRICRIWPLHWMFVTVIFLYVLTVDTGVEFDFFIQWLSHIFFFNNILAALQATNFMLPFTGHLWTIALEEQFYLIVPIAVPFLVGRADPKAVPRILFGVLLLLIASRAACVLMDVPHKTIWRLPLRADSLILGAALGLGIFDRALARLSANLVFGVGALTLVAASALPPIQVSGWTQVLTYTIVDLGWMLVLVGVLGSKALGRLFSYGPIRYFGKVSYGIYVYHMLVIQLMLLWLGDLLGPDSWAIWLGSLALTLLIASLSYEVFEKRFIRMKQSFTSIQSRPA